MAGTTRRRVHTFLGKVFGKLTGKPPVRKLNIKLQTITKAKFPSRFRTHVQLSTVHGKSTKPRLIFSIKTLLQGINRKGIGLRLKTKTQFIKVIRAVAIVIPRLPQKLKVLLQAQRRKELTSRLKTKVQFFKVFGKATKPVKVRAPVVLSQAIKRQILRQRLQTHSYLRKAFGGLAAAYINYGSPFLYTAANWGSMVAYLEVYLRAISGTVYAQLWDETANVAVANSQLNTSNITFTRLRSIALSLTDSHTYRVQLGRFSNSGEAYSGQIIFINA